MLSSGMTPHDAGGQAAAKPLARWCGATTAAYAASRIARSAWTCSLSRTVVASRLRHATNAGGGSRSGSSFETRARRGGGGAAAGAAGAVARLPARPFISSSGALGKGSCKRISRIIARGQDDEEVQSSRGNKAVGEQAFIEIRKQLIAEIDARASTLEKALQEQRKERGIVVEHSVLVDALELAETKQIAALLTP